MGGSNPQDFVCVKPIGHTQKDQNIAISTVTLYIIDTTPTP